MDLTRPAIAAGLVALLAVAPAYAQPLLPNTPLTTLLQPQKLDRSKPLLPQGNLVPSRPAARAAGSPCERPPAASGPGPSALPSAVPPAPRAAYGGSGPGEYARFLPDAPPAGASAAAPKDRPATPPASTSAGVGVDRPLYGGVNRPLWDTAERRPQARLGAARTTGADAAKAGRSDTPSETDATETQGLEASEIPRDRPLWADSLTPSLGTGASPCPPTVR